MDPITLLVANRGEIAIRALRAAVELGCATVAIYTHMDRGSLHRIKADRAYEVGPPDRPLAGYLDAEAIVACARKVGADAVYPGYGFLSESAAFAEAVTSAGLTWIGPPPEVLALTGDKVRARDAAAAAGLPVLAASPTVENRDEALAAAEEIGYPVFVKARGGGGGRGLRLVRSAEDLPAAVETASREAEGAFGDPTVFLERALLQPRHVEVQVLAGADGEVIHLGERDCSVQRRHQKVVEIAPAPNLDEEVRARLHADAVTFARAVEYRNAGTVEFLVDPDGGHVFLEMNPRIQVEHTVTEEVTGVDLVQAQLRIAAGETLADLGLRQEVVRLSGFALQCRITTEDPAAGFRPDTGTITAYRVPGGAGVRLDSGNAEVGTEITPWFDSLLVKLTCRGADLATAAQRARRALAEFRVRGVATNIGFLIALLDDADLLAGRLHTGFLEERPHLLEATAGLDRASKLLRYLADVTVNPPHGEAPAGRAPAELLPPLAEDAVPPDGSRQELQRLGAERFAAALLDREGVAVTDTTMRDAHQSLLATRLRTHDLLTVARHMALTLPQLWSLEVWGGATYDVALRFLHEDPWQRLEQLRAAIPNLCLQMLLRGQNLLGYGSVPDKVVTAFVEEAAATGIDVFRIFDAFNDVARMRPAIQAVLRTDAVAEGAVCYTGDVADEREQLYTLDHYVHAAKGLAAEGVHLLCIKDMAGLLRAPAARMLVTALREATGLAVHLHTHDTAGGQLATLLAAIDSGASVVDVAAAPLAGGTSQPPLSALVAATDATPHATGLDLGAVLDLEPYWEAVRALYAPFESGLSGPSGWVYRHEMPGGQLSNLRQQAAAQGLGDRFAEIGLVYARVDRMLGRLIKVTPSSKVVGDLALYLVSGGIDPGEFEEDPAAHDLPDSVIAFLEGDLGVPPGGWPEPFRTRALRGAREDDTGEDTGDTVEEPAERAEEPADPLGETGDAQDATDEEPAPEQDVAQAPAGEPRRRLLDLQQFPGPAKDRLAAVEEFGDLSVLPTRAFLYGLVPQEEVVVELEPGVTILVELDAVGEADPKGRRTVVARLNGQLRAVDAQDRTVAVAEAAHAKADPANPGDVGAPLTGIVAINVAEGEQVAAGDRLATLEAMKMQSAVTAPTAGTVERVAVKDGARVEPGDLIVVLTPTADDPGEEPREG